MLEYFYTQNKGKELLESFKKVKFSTTQNFFDKHINDTNLLKCMNEFLTKKDFEFIYKFFAGSKDGDVLLFLETIAINLKVLDRAYEISKKIDALRDPKISQKELLNRFLVYSKLYNGLERFFFYVNKHPQYIKPNETNPMIVDFYYEYYLYEIAKKNEDKAIQLLNKLYALQHKFQIFVYSPFVEIELAKWAKLDDDYNKALAYLKEAIKNTRILKDTDKSKIYYEMALIYKKLNKQNRYLDSLDKCKKTLKDTLYKKMCIELQK
jgi:tetratricopeptide (TPR) repeat protein